MAEPDLIARYLAELRRSLSGRDDIEDLLDEIDDHLQLAAQRLCASGADPITAQRETLVRFGRPAIVARAFALNSFGGLAMPTAFTRAAGAIALVTAALWLVAAVVKVWESDLFAPWTEQRLLVFTVVVVLATVGTLVVLAGMVARSGRSALPSAVAMISGGLAVAAFAVMPWGFAIWGLLLTLAFLAALPRLQAATGVRRWTDWAVIAAWPVGLGVLWLMTRLRVGPVDEYGDYQVAVVTAFGVAAILMAVGLAGIGRRLLAERVETPSRPLLPA